MYINCKTYFSFRYGTFSTEQLVNTAIENGVTSLALTNINSTCDAWDFVKLCKETEIKPVLGVEVRNEDQLLYILLAANNNGYAWINEFLSQHLLAKKAFPEVAEKPSFFKSSSDGFIIFPPGTKPLGELQSNEHIGILPWEISKLYST